MSLYNPNIPQFPYNSLAESQKNMLDNFQTLQSSFSVDHFPMDTASSASAYTGNHNIIHLKEQEDALQTGSGEISVYTKDAPGQTDQIFLRYQNNGQEFQYTNYQIYALNPTAIQTSYFTFLPGRILLYFGQFVNLGKQKGVLNLTPAVSTNVTSVSICPIGAAFKDAQKPSIGYIATDKGIYTGIEIKIGSTSNTGTINSPYFYLVTANVL